MYAELSKRVIIYHLSNGKSVESVTLRTTFSEAVKDLIADGRFITCGASMVLNLNHITMVEKEAILFKDTFKLPLSRKMCTDIRTAWYDFCFNGEV